jgi:hypothetical protein
MPQPWRPGSRRARAISSTNSRNSTELGMRHVGCNNGRRSGRTERETPPQGNVDVRTGAGPPRWLVRVPRRDRARLSKKGLRVHTLVAFGSPADEDFAATRDTGADLFVMATRGRSARRRPLFGAVADSLRASPVPVLLIRTMANSEAGPQPGLGDWRGGSASSETRFPHRPRMVAGVAGLSDRPTG